jgi:hypothetical protein
MNRVCFINKTTKCRHSYECSKVTLHGQNQHAGCIRPLKDNAVRIKKMAFILSTVAILCIHAGKGHAQYPDIPGKAQAWTDSLMLAVEHNADSAWAIAYPIVREEARHDRPYVPWAHQPYQLVRADIPAFPGAEGGGAYTPGGRGGRVVVVTSLEDKGHGTFREACEQGGARIIVFNVSGIIHLKSPIVMRAPYVTIAGQTAPGDGICVAGESVWINTHDVIIRHMRFRRGETFVGRRDDAVGGHPVGNIMIDHVSASWGLDENMSIYRHNYNDSTGKPEERLFTVNITIQNSIFSECLDTWNHAFGSTIGGENCTFMRNLWACNTGRNPSIGCSGVFNFVNNVIFNWVHRSVDGGDYMTQFNIINNYYKPGPQTPKDDFVGHRILKPESGRSKLKYKVFGRCYVNGNIMEGYPDITKNNWDGGVQIEDLPNCDTYTADMRVNEPFPMPKLTIIPSQKVFDHVLTNCGALLPKRDAVDTRVTSMVRTGVPVYNKNYVPDATPQFKTRRLPKDSYINGIITDIAQVGGYPEYKGLPYKDSDNDGMPDEWEKKYGLNPKDPKDATSDINGDGYTNIEKYINNINPTKKVDWKDPKNNYDTLAEKQ